MKIAYFSSGLLGYETLLKLKLNPCIIYTDSNSIDLINFSKKQQIPIYIGNPRELRAIHFFENYVCDLILSVNYLFIIKKELFLCAKLGAINIHGSLLPKYRGRTPHVWAIINGEKETGVTVHFIDEGCDTGDIITQSRILIKESYTGQSILDKFKIIYPKILKKVLNNFKNNSVKATKQNNKNSSYFGKRSPEDGIIDWNKSSKEIYDWVRAQSYPYPGAFTFYNNQKIIIDWVKIKKDNFVSNLNLSPGCIIKLKPITVKTKDGSIIIDKIRNKVVNFKVNQYLKNE